MKSIMPLLEVIVNTFGNSFSYAKYSQNDADEPYLWHYHPQFELIYVNGGAGKRHIGNHISYYTNGSLVLIGPNLPHNGFTTKVTGHSDEIVIHFKADFLGEQFFETKEMLHVFRLLEQSKSAIAFGGETKSRIGLKLEAMENQDPYARLLTLLEILNELSISEEHRILNADGFQLEMHVQDNDRINLVYNFIKENFQRHISIDEICEVVNMTKSSFCRNFKKITNKTFTELLNEYRLVYATKLLAEEPMTINEVCFECGFNNFSHFSKSFKKFTGKSASEYRHELRTMIM